MVPSPRLRVLVGLCLGWLVACEGTAPPGDDVPRPDAGIPGEHASWIEQISRGDAPLVLVIEREDSAMPSDAAGLATAALGAASARESLHRLVPPEDRVFEGRALPIVAVRVRSIEQLEALESLDGALRLEPERTYEASAEPSLELIGQPAALARGADGRGLSVAVLDTGVDYTRPELGACATAAPDCPVSFAADFAPEDHLLDSSARHGTNVAGIVHLVAPAAHILALDVFTDGSASSIDIVEAIDWVITQRDAHAIIAVNLSLGYGAFTAPCGTDVLAVALGRLRAAGVLPVVATGNNGYLNAIASPACAPAAVSVGAVDGSGRVASFSNTASFMTLLAPGVGITAAGVTMSGTSQASPHAAGAVAAMRSAYPSDTLDDLVARLVGTGLATTDARNGLTRPRIALDAATLGGATAPPPDIAAPTGTLALAGPYVRALAVPYTITATDASAITAMCLGTGTSCTTFVPFAASGTFTVPSGDGVKTVRAWLRDAAGNVTPSALTATTTLDTRAPTAGTLTAIAGIGRLTLTISGVSDTGSGLIAHRVVVSTGSTAPASCATGTLVAESSTTTLVIDGLAPGSSYRYRACGVDRAGNVSTGATVTATPVAELDPPTGSISIEGGATWARTSRVSVGVTASDASGMGHACFSTSSASCIAWVAYAPLMTATLASGSGERALYAWLRDRWGNRTVLPVSDTIRVDLTPPPSPSVSVARQSSALLLSWPAVLDAAGGSGVSGYRVALIEGTRAPSSCASAVAVTDTQHRAEGLVDGRSYAFRVCSTDTAGHMSSGAIGTAIPAPELAAPTSGTVLIAGGASWTRTTTVTLSLGASDPSGVASMCLATSPSSCASWRPYASTATIALASGSGARVAYAWFRDLYGNATSTPVSDGIFIDTAAPPNPTVTATARSRAVELQWTASLDAISGSGTSAYLVAWSTGASAPSCASGASVSLSLPRFLRADVSAGAVVRWRVCARDAVGNVSSGASGTTTALP